jgi:hypothetical protein
MSIKYMNRVWDSKELKGGRLLVMLVLADHANDAGECWPSQPHLAARARLDARQVRRVVDGLDKEGYLLILERGKGRSKRPHYRLFPQPVKSDILSEVKSDISDTKSDILSPENRTFPTEKSDISDRIPSHARSEPPIEPITEPPIESSSSEDEEEEALTGDAVEAAWMETFGASMPETLLPLMARLLAECGEAAVIHGIKAAAEAKARKFAYIAKCARNYIPPAPASNGHGRYSVDLPGVVHMEPPGSPPPVAQPPPPLKTDDPWMALLAEIAPMLPPVVNARLAGSRLEQVDFDHCSIILAPHVTDGVDWLDRQAGPAITRTLRSMFRRKVEVEIVAAPQGAIATEKEGITA